MSDYIKLPGNYTSMMKFGKTPDMDAADTNEEVWDGTGAYSFLSAATALTISSSDVDDLAGDTGARSIRVHYLDANYLEQTADIPMNGQNASATTITALRVYRAYVLTAGSTLTNEGDIWIGSGALTNGVPANKYAGILAGEGQTLMAIYTVPADYAGALLMGWYANCAAVSGAAAEVALQVRELGGAFRTQRTALIGTGGTFTDDIRFPLEIGAKADIRVRVISNVANNTSISAGFDLALL